MIVSIVIEIKFILSPNFEVFRTTKNIYTDVLRNPLGLISRLIVD